MRSVLLLLLLLVLVESAVHPQGGKVHENRLLHIDSAFSPTAEYSVDAFVYARRELSRSVAFLTLGDGNSFEGAVLPQCILSSERAELEYGVRPLAKLAAPGSQVRIRGTVERHDRGWNLLVANSIDVIRCAPLYSSVRSLRRSSRPLLG